MICVKLLFTESSSVTAGWRAYLLKEIQWIEELTGGTWKHIGGNLWKSISVKDLRFALRAIDEIYGLTDKDIQITGNKNSFRLTFFFMQRKITVDKREDGNHTVNFQITV